MKGILSKYTRLAMRDALHVVFHLCELMENLENVQVGDDCWLHQAICLNLPGWRRTIKTGRMELVARLGELDMGDLLEPTGLPSQWTMCTYVS